jgi:hypothetical protein
VRKLIVALALLAGYGFVCSLGPVLPGPGGGWSIAEYVLMLAIPVGLFIWAIRGFHGLHKRFHQWVILEAMKMRRSS